MSGKAHLGALSSAASSLPEPPDTPDLHGFVMTGGAQVFLSHLPMFYVENHCYEVLLGVTLQPEEHETYLRVAAENPDQAMILGNSAERKMTLQEMLSSGSFPAEAFVGIPDESSKPYMSPEVQVGPVLIFEHFNPAAQYPPTLTYYLYGAGDEAHLSHAMARPPDFQQELTLARVPEGVGPQELAAGVPVSIPSLPTPPKPVTADPLQGDRYKALLPNGTTTTLEIARRHYFDSTMLNMPPHQQKGPLNDRRR